MRITAAVPATILDDANELAMVLAFGPSDGDTYRNPSWRDAQGNLYAVASWETSPQWVAAAQGTLERPTWDVEPYTVNMAGAERAQDALVFWAYDPEGNAPQATTTALTAIAGVDGLEALDAMGLTRAEQKL